MKVLLTQDIAKLGSAGEVREVAGGFGRNYLIPKGMAVLATRGQIKQAEERIAAQRRRENAMRGELEALAAQLNGITLRFTAKATGDLDRLYGSVTNMDIANRLHEEHNIEVDRRKIDLAEPIKRMGVYPVKVKVATDLEPLLNIVVEGEGGETAVAPADVTDEDAAAPAATADAPAEADAVPAAAASDTEAPTA